MSIEFYCPMCDETHDDPAACPEAEGDADDEELSTDEIREGVCDELTDAHAAFVVYVTFPRADNDEDEMRCGSGRFIDTDDLSKTELVAAAARLEQRIEEVNDELNGDDGPLQGAVGIPTKALFGDGGSDLPDTDGGGMFR